MRSRISRRSKKGVPPTVRQGMPRRTISASMGRMRVLARHSTAMSPGGEPLPTRVATSSASHEASSDSSSAARRVIGSPSPAAVHSCLSGRLALWAITALAAARMVPVERKFCSSTTVVASG